MSEPGDVREAEACIATEQKHIPAAVDASVVSGRKSFYLLKFIGGEMITSGSLCFDLVPAERILLRIDQIFVDGSIDMPLQMFQVFGYGILVLGKRFHVRLKITYKLIINVVKADTRSESP